MDPVTGVVGSLLSKLGELLKEKYDLQKGVPEQIQSLIQELECAQVALWKVAEVAPDQLDPQVRIWARHVKEASYDMEDILDTFHVHIEGCRDSADKKSLLKRLIEKMIELFKKSKGRHDITRMIEEIKKRLQEVIDRRNRFSVDNTVAKPTAPSTIDPRLIAMYKEVTQLVGIDKSKGELISMLSSKGEDRSKKKLKIVSVVGVGGLGKTTLVKTLYDNLKSGYDCSAFVSVGRNPDLISVFKSILFDLDKNKYNEIHNTTRGPYLLINELHGFLGNKRYFIVIDDIWETQSWETIKLALVDDDSGSTVITTTRKFEVAIKAGEVYKLQPLSDGCVKNLFYTRIFGGEDKCPDSELDDVSDKILKKCGGIPLAVITMASLLVGKSREEWFEVQNTIGFHDKDNKQVDDTMWIVSLSYYDLPSHLRTCLLYLSAFSEDCFIEKDSLIWKWIAEGFIEKRQGVRLFDLAEEYFHDLINRSMIHAEESEEDGFINGCRIHDMVLDFIRYMSSKENFFIVSGNNEGSSSSARRLAHQNRTVEHIHQSNHKGMRSFIAFGCTMDKPISLPSFTVLRVLALERCRHVKGCLSLKYLINLLHLRYLGLRYSRIGELPVEMGVLKFLQVLDLEGTDIAELPSTVGLLTCLVCLRACHMFPTIRVPNGVIDKLTSLEELAVRVRPHDDDMSKMQFMKELSNLSELRVLETMIADMNKSMQSDFLRSVGNLHKLQHLRLDGWIPRGETNETEWGALVPPRSLRHLIIPGIVFSMLPSSINASCLPNLSRLVLMVDSMDEQGLKTLGTMPELRHLGLNILSTVTLTNIATEGCFQKLTSCSFDFSVVQFVLNEDSTGVSFTLWYEYDVVNLGSTKRKNDSNREASAAVMPNLQRLRFPVRVRKLMHNNNNGICDNLGLEYLPSLQKVRVNLDCWDAFSNDVEKEEAALRHAIEVHPNRPTLRIDFQGKEGMMSRPGIEREDKTSSSLDDHDEAAVTLSSPRRRRTDEEEVTLHHRMVRQHRV